MTPCRCDESERGERHRLRQSFRLQQSVTSTYGSNCPRHRPRAFGPLLSKVKGIVTENLITKNAAKGSANGERPRRGDAARRSFASRARAPGDSRDFIRLLGMACASNLHDG